MQPEPGRDALDAGAATGRPGTGSPDRGAPAERQVASMTAHEEEWTVGKETVLRTVRLRKRVDQDLVSEQVPRAHEIDRVERVSVAPGDSGRIENLPDSSISIPVLEKELVVTKRVVVRERIIIRKEVRVEQVSVRDVFKAERIEVAWATTAPQEDEHLDAGGTREGEDAVPPDRDEEAV